MIIFSVFILLLLLENLFLPALIGSGPFLITLIFIIGLVMYSQDWKRGLTQALCLLLVKGFFAGSDLLTLFLPFSITAVLYLLLNRFINFTEQFRENISPASVIFTTILLSVFTLIYSYLFILFTNPFNVLLSWVDFIIFFKGSLIGILGWSAAISILFKYALPKTN